MATAETDCYHCGLPLPQDGTAFPVEIAGEARQMCCAGCQAVAQSIVDSGLTAYYQHRDAMPESRKEAMPLELQELGLFDHPQVQQSFVQDIGEHEREASLMLEGMTCAACVWLNERHLACQPGVRHVSVNYATRRARVRWDTRETQLSDILAAIQAIGYRAWPYDAEQAEALAQRERRGMLWRVFVAGFGMMQVMMYAFPAYIAPAGDLSMSAENIMRGASLLLTLPVVLYSAAPFFRNAWRDIKMRQPGMDVPVALGIGSAFAASVWATLTEGPQVYFDSVTMFVFLLLLGRYLEMLARQRAMRGVESIAKILPVFAERLDAAGSVVRVPVAELAVGDRLRVRPGETFPADGVVLEGHSEADESLLTGESRPVPKAEGDAITGGCINITSPLTVEVRQVGETTRLATIRRLMERASHERPRISLAADRVARVFIVCILLMAAAAWLVWEWHQPDRALWVFVSVLVVACPCALSLATPVAMTVATDTLARSGVLVTRGHAIETLARANVFAFDKTGTLTHGRLQLERIWTPDGHAHSEQAALALAAVLEAGSEHAIARALLAAAHGAAPATLAGSARAVTGQGMEAQLPTGRTVRIGRPTFVADCVGTPAPAAVAELEAAGASVIALGENGHWQALFAFSDHVREDAPLLLGQLRTESIPAIILSGDAPAPVHAVAHALGISEAHAGMSPQDKHDWLAARQRQAGAVVAMIGDGVNDAPVLAQAHVSIAMGGGTDLARTQADIVLLSNHLGDLARGIHLARRTLRIVKQNLWWSFAYNFTAVPLAMTGIVTPWMAGIGMAASSLLVVLNALRLASKPHARTGAAHAQQSG